MAAMWLLQLSMKNPSTALFNPNIALRAELSCKRQKEGAISTNIKGLSYFLERYATDDAMAETNTEKRRVS